MVCLNIIEVSYHIPLILTCQNKVIMQYGIDVIGLSKTFV